MIPRSGFLLLRGRRRDLRRGCRRRGCLRAGELRERSHRPQPQIGLVRLPKHLEIRRDKGEVFVARLADLRARRGVHRDGDGRGFRGAQCAEVRGVGSALLEPHGHPPGVARLVAQIAAFVVRSRSVERAFHRGARAVRAEDKDEEGLALGLGGRDGARHVALVKQSHLRAFVCEATGHSSRA